MRVDRERRGMIASPYSYRRPLGLRESLPAVGAGLALGLAGFYIARLLLQRTPLVPQAGVPVVGERGTIVRRPARPRIRG